MVSDIYRETPPPEVTSGPSAQTRSLTKYASRLLPVIVLSILVLLLWLPVGFYTTGLVEEWQFYDLAMQGVPLVPASSWNVAHALRPFVALTFQLGYWLTPDSFLGLNLVMLVTFIGKAMSLYALLRLLLPNSRSFALFASALFIIYPADSITMALRGISIHLALMTYLMAAVFFLMYWKKSHWYFMAGAWFMLILSLGIYEPSYIFSALTPLLLLILEKRVIPTRRMIRVSLLWYLPQIAYLGWYMFNLLTTSGSYQQAHFSHLMQGNFSELANHILLSIQHLLNWNFLAGWQRALNALQYDSTTLLIALGIALLVGGTGFWLSRIRVPVQSNSNHTRDYLGAALIGFILMGIAYAPYGVLRLLSMNTERVFYYTAVGAAVCVMALLYLIAMRLFRSQLLFIVVGSIVVGIAAAGALVQHQHFANWSREQQRLYAAIIEAFPEISDETILIVYQDQNPPSLSHFPDYPITLYPDPIWLKSAIRYVYQNDTLQATFCDTYTLYYRAGYCDEELNEVSPDRLIVAEYFPVSGQVVILDQMPDKYSSITLPAEYDPYQRFKKDEGTPPKFTESLLSECFPASKCSPASVQNIFYDFDSSIQSRSWWSTYTTKEDISSQWSVMEDALLSFPALTQQDYHLSFRITDIGLPENRQDLELVVNDHKIPLTEIGDQSGGYIYEAIVSEQLITPSSTDLVFSVPQLKPIDNSPALGIAVDWLRIEPTVLEETVHFEFDKTIREPGWRGAETSPDGITFQWMTAEEASLSTVLQPETDYTLKIRVTGAMSQDILESFAVMVDGDPIELMQSLDGSGTVFSGFIPRQKISGPYSRLTFQTDGTAIPEGGPGPLSVAVDWVRLDPVIWADAARIEFDQVITGSGWRGPEVVPDGISFQWMTATETTIDNLLLNPVNDYTLSLRIVHILSPEIQESLSVEVNGQTVDLTQEVTDDFAAVYTATIPKSLLSNSFTDLRFKIDALTLIEDTAERLGLAFDWVDVTAIRP